MAIAGWRVRRSARRRFRLSKPFHQLASPPRTRKHSPQFGVPRPDAVAVEEHGREIVEVYLRAMRRGDWRAAEALMSRIYGKPEETVRQVEVNPATAVLKSMSLEEKLELLHSLRRGDPIALPVVEAVPPTA